MTKKRVCKNCGNIKLVKLSYIERNSKCANCGNTEHTLEENNLYYIWKSMLSRCYNKAHKAYAKYGGYGITVCTEWVNSFTKFAEWASIAKYKKGLFLDKDILCHEKNIYPHMYSPDTCTWISRTLNNQKTRLLKSDNTSGYRGVTFNKNLIDFPWEAKICVDNKRIKLGYWSTKLEAAKAYDYYVITNNLMHTTNNVLEDNEVIDIDTANNRLRSDNTTGCKGVLFRKDTNKWAARITVKSKKYNLGCFDTKEEAIVARKIAEIKFTKEQSENE